MRWRVRAGYPVAVLFWIFARPSYRSIALGGIIAAFGLLVRGLAAGHLKKDRELAISGPYAVTRNPLYLGSSL
ncbi:MAG: methyltransferase family protein, partial [Terracidiphilus sp.]